MTDFNKLIPELYGEKYALKGDPKVVKGRRIYEFTAFNTNFSSGKKQGEISCFDIAYTIFADEENIPCMHFLLHRSVAGTRTDWPSPPAVLGREGLILTPGVARAILRP